MVQKYIRCYTEAVAQKLSEAIYELTRPEGEDNVTTAYFPYVKDVDNDFYLQIELDQEIPICTDPQIEKFNEILDFFETNNKITNADRLAIIAKVLEKNTYPLADFLNYPSIDLYDEITLLPVEGL